jgi:hypothetical protein
MKSNPKRRPPEMGQSTASRSHDGTMGSNAIDTQNSRSKPQAGGCEVLHQVGEGQTPFERVIHVMRIFVALTQPPESKASPLDCIDDNWILPDGFADQVRAVAALGEMSEQVLTAFASVKGDFGPPAAPCAVVTVESLRAALTNLFGSLDALLVSALPDAKATDRAHAAILAGQAVVEDGGRTVRAIAAAAETA